MSMTWVSVDDALPEDGQAVLVCRSANNWHMSHTLANGEKRKLWRWTACIFRKGRTREEAELAGVYRAQDQAFNNAKPYCWEEFGPGCLFGQDVSYWCAIEDPVGDSDRIESVWPYKSLWNFGRLFAEDS